MRRDDSGAADRERDLRVRYLTVAALAAELAHRLDVVQEAAGTEVGARHEPAVRVHRQVAAELDPPALDEAAALALAAEAVVLELHQLGDREAVVELRDV